MKTNQSLQGCLDNQYNEVCMIATVMGQKHVCMEGNRVKGSELPGWQKIWKR